MPVDPGAATRAVLARVARALTPSGPVARIAVLRPVVYLFVIADMHLVVNDVVAHGEGSQDLYRPLLIRRLLELPTPDPGYVHALYLVLVVSSLVAASGRLPRLAGTVVALGLLDWVSIGFSYSKVDHDHFALVVTVFVLATVPRAGWRDPGSSEAAGWALLCIQAACVAVYALSAVAKLRYGGWDWAGGAVFAWALSRRGTELGRPLLGHPDLLRAAQWLLLSVEASTVSLLFLRGRLRYVFVGALLAFHLTTYLTIKIHFLPLAVCLLAFLPLERLPTLLDRVTGGTAGPGSRRIPRRVRTPAPTR